MIDQVTVDRILQTAQIEDVVGEFVSLRKRWVNMIGLCPFHVEKTPSSTVSPPKNICKCFVIGKGLHLSLLPAILEPVNVQVRTFRQQNAIILK